MNKKETSPSVYIAEFGFVTGRPTTMFLSALPHPYAWAADSGDRTLSGFAVSRESAERATQGMSNILIIETQVGSLHRRSPKDREVIVRTLRGDQRTVFIRRTK